MKESIYLDANMIYGYFLSKYRELKKKERFAEPKVIEFLRENKEKFEYFVSTITYGEIIRRLRTELNLEEQEALELWESFLEDLRPIEFEENEIDWKLINEIVLKVKIKKRLSNLIHLVSYIGFRNWEDLNKQKANNNHEREIQGNNSSFGRKETQSKSTNQNNFTQGIREEGNGNNEESHRKRRKEALEISHVFTPFLILLLLSGIAFATHNPSVSHNANGVINWIISGLAILLVSLASKSGFIDIRTLVHIDYKNIISSMIDFVKYSVISYTDAKNIIFSLYLNGLSGKRIISKFVYFFFNLGKLIVLPFSKSLLASLRALTSAADRRASSKYSCLLFRADNSLLISSNSVSSLIGNILTKITFKAFIIFIAFSSIAFATHNPSVSHPANAVTNGTFLDKYLDLEVRL